MPSLIRLLARDMFYPRISALLEQNHHISLEFMLAALRNDSEDFVIRRRLPAILSRVGGAEVEEALFDVLNAKRFEVRYRAAIAISRRRRNNLPKVETDKKEHVFDVIRAEVNKSKPYGNYRVC